MVGDPLIHVRDAMTEVLYNVHQVTDGLEARELAGQEGGNVGRGSWAKQFREF
jgi:hypothetical protein